jgi:hypothetical protein
VVLTVGVAADAKSLLVDVQTLGIRLVLVVDESHVRQGKSDRRMRSSQRLALNVQSFSVPEVFKERRNWVSEVSFDKAG